ncbi:MAG: 23S rRNA (adenine(2503)-C(2))-methyltransferase RlmN [Candidatus Omnitrophica bacterium]|nr:23S rRNA (adenine(2503)-C(2))-methyltransferase RlmN [Candidatus Omnitrophota bacterium]
MKKIDIKNLSSEELQEFLLSNGLPKFRAEQIRTWIFQKAELNLDKMVNLPLPLRKLLDQHFIFWSLKLCSTKISKDKTIKNLFELSDGELIETVLIPADGRNTVCVSTQAGCKFGCKFCASGLKGWKRNLTAGEICEQILLIQKEAGVRVTHVVFMGVGEPFDNYENVIKAVRAINAKDGMGIAARRITISTCGVVPGIERFAGEGLQVELAISLHASNDKLRDEFMPINKKYPLKELIKCCGQYVKKTDRQITFEYILIKDITCTENAARELGVLLRGLLCKLNLIVYNPVQEFAFKSVGKSDITQFQKWLKAEGLHSTVRASRGTDVSAACGQLRTTFLS